MKKDNISNIKEIQEKLDEAVKSLSDSELEELVGGGPGYKATLTLDCPHSETSIWVLCIKVCC